MLWCAILVSGWAGEWDKGGEETGGSRMRGGEDKTDGWGKEVAEEILPVNLLNFPSFTPSLLPPSLPPIEKAVSQRTSAVLQANPGVPSGEKRPPPPPELVSTTLISL